MRSRRDGFRIAALLKAAFGNTVNSWRALLIGNPFAKVAMVRFPALESGRMKHCVVVVDMILKGIVRRIGLRWPFDLILGNIHPGVGFEIVGSCFDRMGRKQRTDS